MSTFRPQFHRRLAKFFLDDIFYKTGNYYYFLGRVQPWDVIYQKTTTKANDSGYCDCVITSVEYAKLSDSDYDTILNSDPNEAYYNDIDIRNNILFMKKISPNDVSMVVKRYDWKRGMLVDQWDDTKEMKSTTYPFYVVNSENRVYKCLNNNSSYVPINGDVEKVSQSYTESMVEPTGTGQSIGDIIKTDDGFLWKYMYTIPRVKQSRFVSSDFIPVQTALEESFYNNGSIERIDVLKGGEGYSSSVALRAIVSAPEADYILEDGTIAKKTQAKITPVIDAQGSIASVIIDDAGSGYGNVPQITIEDASGNASGTGKYNGNTSAILQANILNGKLDSVSIIDPGKGYSTKSSTYLAISGDGHGASASPTVSADGKIVGVVVNSGGSGYTYADIRTVRGGNNQTVTTEYEDAEFSIVVGGSNISTDQSMVEQYASTYEGSIFAIAMKATGNHYHDVSYNEDGSVAFEGTKVIISGDGDGATAHAIVDANGGISQVVMDTYGKGYTYAVISFEDDQRVGDGCIDASAYAIMSPLGGHGKNAPDELFADTLGIYVPIDDVGDLKDLEQDFRQFGILYNPKTVLVGNKYTASEATALFKVNFESVLGLKEDGLISISYEGTGEDGTVHYVPHRIVKIVGKEVTLQQMSPIYFDITEYCTAKYYDEDKGVTSVYSIEAVTSAPSIDKYSGDLLCVSNNAPYVIDDNKTIGVRSFITF